MLKFNRRDEPADLRDGAKATPAKAAPYGSSGTSSSSGAATTPAKPSTPASTAAAAGAAAAGAAKDAASGAATSGSPMPAPSAETIPTVDQVQGSRLFVGVNIRLKGVEISNCDALTVEGQVEATVNSKAMEIARPGTLTGTATIDIAEIHGEFSGELTARTRLVVHGTGRVSGTIRYGKLIVAEGGELTGDIKRLEGGEASSSADLPLMASAHHAR